MSQHALKEWAAVCRALDAGRQSLLLRKGGIAEPGGAFRVAHPAFFLLPTFAHQRPELLTPEAQGWLAETLARRDDPERVELDLFARVVATYALEDPAVLEALAAEHVLAPRYAAERLRWKPRQPLWALVLRVHRVIDPPVLEQTAAHAGCVSWIELERSLDVTPDRLVPVLGDDAHAAAVERIRRALT